MLKRILIDALALAVATWALPGITLADPWSMRGIVTLVGVAIIFGLVNALVKPLFKALTGCLILLSFGLFLLVVNGVMMLLVSWLCGKLGLGWHVGPFAAWGWHFNTFETAVLGGLIVAVVSFFAAKLLKDRGVSARARETR